MPPARLFVFVSIVVGLTACGDSGGGASAVDADSDGVAAAVDCNDADPLVFEPQPYFIDADEDGVGGTTVGAACAAAPPLGFSTVSTDCNDADANLQATSDYFVDQDLDGVGASLIASLCLAVAPSGYSEATGDCNDADGSVATEVDYYSDTDGDGFGVGAATAICASVPPAGFAAVASDPDDANPNRTPADLDGDGVANAADCAPDDGSVYALSTYFYDFDLDGLGTDEVELCQSLPAPDVFRHAKVQGDECPWVRNTDEDLDEDGLDDACDVLIHFTEDRTFGPDVISLRGRARPEETVFADREYRIGSEGNPVTLRFEGTRAFFGSCLHWSLHGGSSLVFETLDAADRTSVVFEDGSPNCFTRVEGVSPAEDSPENTLAFLGAYVELGKYVQFQGIHSILFAPAEDVVDGSELITLGSAVRTGPDSFGPNRYWIEEQYPVVTGSASHGGALIVRDQFLPLFGFRFIGNAGYPVECQGGTFRQPESAGYVSYAFNSNRLSCQTAVTRSYFADNGRDGPLIDVYDSREEDPAVQNYSIWRNEEARRPYPDWGTNVVYVKRLDLRDSSWGSIWGMEFRPHVMPDSEFVGAGPAPDVVNASSLLRLGTTGANQTRLTVQSSDLSHLPIKLEGTAHLVFYDESVVGPVIMENLEPSELGVGPYLGVIGGTIDLVSGPFVVETGAPGIVERVGVFLQAASNLDPGHIGVEYRPYSSYALAFFSRILSSSSIDQPILALGTPRSNVDYDSPVSLDQFVETEGVAVEDAVEIVVDGCCRSAEFILR